MKYFSIGKILFIETNNSGYRHSVAFHRSQVKIRERHNDIKRCIHQFHIMALGMWGMQLGV